VPWSAGISWPEPLYLIFSWPKAFSYVPVAFLLLIVPPMLILGGLVLFWQPQTINEKKFRLFSLWFFSIVAVVFSLLYIYGSTSAGGHLDFEDRYFRSAGTLLFVCALISAFAVGTPRWMRGLFLA